MTAWKDITSYPRGGRKAGEKPRTWEIASGTLRVVVTRHLRYGPDEWLLRCDEIGMGESLLKSTDIDAAKREALDRVRMRAEAILAHVTKMQEVTP